MKKKYIGAVVGLVIGIAIAYGSSYIGNEIIDLTSWLITSLIYFILPAIIIGFMIGHLRDKKSF
ncbi:hypothetical protein COU62_00585 [Candidatus Pacearchaeota archaeon CG10_big_fil_rev_8_21_14_0_10_35_219]|nr:hypothetical protein [Candidatus Pacearchaeota archaeon]OIO42690.1 MAG: hypothetical protein AUJ63_02140 [Candidatus Pacearchaeota archaeon CG1_02_35_32]PIO08286.1 MAG: hypothetical protein COU62_00585 [Candidatus Pacearchaeota archaeon CG10_big_fil_rev_8_21_14_0_10_35_219]PIY81887.1 MAG: hypothetical protein COY79_00325 [Candidatus Pacearchaeota archaeon CG_4_10_14_0_8_um_filter_35_169]PIZ79372.1 MAG: hypothetical protein COY00_04310 [Candidatus Pacearchaeota archaeon CG_4_10_14_0_2_um_filt